MEFIAFVVRAVGARMQQKGDLIAGSNFMMLLAPLGMFPDTTERAPGEADRS